jgi:hypothetical protein
MSSWIQSFRTERGLARLSMVAIAGTIVTHVLTFLPTPWILLVIASAIDSLALIPFIAMIATLTSWRPASARQLSRTMWDLAQQRGEAIARFLNPCPAWAVALFFLLQTYVIVNLFLYIDLSDGGAPEMRDGHYYLTAHGETLRELTFSEYRKQQVYLVRLLSGFWIVFSSTDPTTYRVAP